MRLPGPAAFHAYVVNTMWLLALIAVSGLIYIRVAPSDPAYWHIDPTLAASPGESGVLVRPGDGDITPAPRDMPPAALLSRLDAIIMATPRTRRVAGSVEEGRVTYVTRSLVFGFPDYATVTAISRDGESFPVILSRARFGRSDLGVNRARVEKWLEALKKPG
ncbi:MAG: DUF1499 domain-containing protein [Paracoccaceae bacterium]